MSDHNFKSLAGIINTGPIDASQYFDGFIDPPGEPISQTEERKAYRVYFGSEGDPPQPEQIQALLPPNSFVLEVQKCDGQSEEEKSSLTKVEKALDLAHDIRKFEIELFWKRATFFWTLLAATIITFGAIISAKDLDPTTRWGLLTLISLAGSVAAAVLLFANKGSKFWQRNWEYQVDMLENMITGPLYKTVISKQPGTYSSRFDIASSYNFSVSALANILAWLFFVVFIIFLAITSFRFGIEICSKASEIKLLDPELLFGVLCTLLAVGFCLLLIHWASSFGEMSTKLAPAPASAVQSGPEVQSGLEARPTQATEADSGSEKSINESNTVKLMISRRVIT